MNALPHPPAFTEPALPETAPLRPAPRGFDLVDTWIFDLDNTLYPAGSDVWPLIDARITAYVCGALGLDGLSARALQKYWYERYGTTLKALIDEYGVDPHDFLAFAHDIDRSTLLPNPVLGAAIARLPGRKLILTNGSREHARLTAERLGIYELFEDVFDIAAADFLPKPERATYERFLARHGVDPACAAMFEDLEKNLHAPNALGMTTVLVVPAVADPRREAWENEQPLVLPHVDWVTNDLPHFLSALTPVEALPGATGQPSALDAPERLPDNAVT